MCRIMTNVLQSTIATFVLEVDVGLPSWLALITYLCDEVQVGGVFDVTRALI